MELVALEEDMPHRTAVGLEDKVVEENSLQMVVKKGLRTRLTRHPLMGWLGLRRTADVA